MLSVHFSSLEFADTTRDAVRCLITLIVRFSRKEADYSPAAIYH